MKGLVGVLYGEVPNVNLKQFVAHLTGPACVLLKKYARGIC